MVKRKYIMLRFGMLFMLFVLFAFRIQYRVWSIQNVDTHKLETLRKSIQENTQVIEPMRGNVCADDGSILSTSIPSYELRYDLRADMVKLNYAKYSDEFSLEMAKYFGFSKSQFKKRLDKAYARGSRWFSIYPERVDYNTLKGLKALDIMAYRKMGAGLISQLHNYRLMPHGDMASRTIGTLNEGAYGGVHGNIGYSGVEGMMESYLAGHSGLSLKQNLSGRWVSTVEKEPENGQDVITTINVNLQDFTENALRKQMMKSQAAWGTAVVMEVATGDIKAIANVGQRKNGTYGEVYNYALGHQGCGEPGSTFKLMSLMACMEDGYIDTTDVFDVGIGRWDYKGQTIYDSDYGHGGHGKINVKEIFELSSNVGTAMAVTKSYEGRETEFIDRIYNFGLNKPLNLGFAGEGVPYIKYPTDENWWGPSLAWISYGYEIKLTPLQTLTFYSAVANNGRMMKPRFVSEIRENGSLVHSFEPEVLNPSICSSSTLSKAHAMLRGACVEGTGKNVQKGLPITIAGKTGTAQVAYGDGGYGHGTGRKKYQASFAGYFPAEDPKYAMIVVVLDPKGSFYGGSVAGPVFKDVAAKVYATMMQPIESEPKEQAEVKLITNAFVEDAQELTSDLGIETEELSSLAGGNVSVEVDSLGVEVKQMNTTQNVVPNVKGMTMSDAIYMLESLGMKVRFTGFGKVSQQSIKAGTPIRAGRVINLKLS